MTGIKAAVILALVGLLAAFVPTGAAAAPMAAATNVPAFTTGAPIQVGNSPADNAYDPIHGWWLVANSESDSVSVIQANDSRPVATVPVGNSPEGIEVLYNRTTGFDQAWTTDVDGDTVTTIQLSNLTVTHVIPVGSEPDKICFAAGLHVAFVLNDASDNITVISTTISHDVLGQVWLGPNPSAPLQGWAPDGCAYDDDTEELFVAEEAGNQVAVVNVSTWAHPVWAANITDVYSAGAMSLAPAPYHETFVADSGAASETVVTHHAPRVVAVIPIGDEPEDSDYDAQTAQIFVVNSGSDTVSVISAASNEVVATVGIGESPQGIVYDPVDGLFLVCNGGANDCQVISDGTGGSNGTLFPSAVAAEGGGGGALGGPSTFPVIEVVGLVLLLGSVGAVVGAILYENRGRGGLP